MLYLIEESAGRALADARRASPAFSAEQLLAFDEQMTAANEPRNVVRAGSTLEIRVEGLLTEKPDLWAFYYGGGNTTYDSIARALAVAATDDGIRDVVLRVSSPGGTVDGLFDALSAIESFRANSGKKLKTVATKAQSAAYAIAAASGNIVAANSASMFGSIGTAIDFFVSSFGKTLSVTNTDSPAKRPDPETEEGRAEIVRFLDQVNELFVRSIANGRETSSQDVTENFGRGASFVADEAKRRGMVDSIANPMAKANASSKGKTTTVADGAGKDEAMDLKTLKAQHPDVYEAAVAEGTERERARVAEHIEMAEGSGDTALAFKSIRDGDAVNGATLKLHFAAAKNRQDIGARQLDSDAAAAALKDAKNNQVTGRDLGDAVADAILGGGI